MRGPLCLSNFQRTPTACSSLMRTGPVINLVGLALTRLIDSGELTSISLGFQDQSPSTSTASLSSSTSITFDGDGREGRGREEVRDVRGVEP